MKTPRCAPVLAALLSLALSGSAAAVEIPTRAVDVSFHISHPAKEYDSFLTPDGGHGTISLDPRALEATTARFSIKVDHFSSDNVRRDSHMVETMEAFVYPSIEWSVDKVTGLAGPLVPGVHSGVATGPLTVHGVTRQLQVPIELTVGGQAELTIGAQFTILLEDYGIERPTLVFVPIENELPIVVKVTTRPDPALLEAAAAAPAATPALDVGPDPAADAEPTPEEAP